MLEFVGGELPLKDADGSGVEGDAETFVGDLQHGLDALAFLVFGAKAAVGEFGGGEAGAGGAGEMDAQAEQESDAEAGEEGYLGEGALVLVEEIRRGRHDDTDAAVFQREHRRQREGIIGGAVEAGTGVVKGFFADEDLAVVVQGDLRALVDGCEKLLVAELGADERDPGAGAVDGRVNGKTQATAGHHERAGDRRRAVVDRNFKGVKTVRLAEVIEADQRFVARRRPIPLGHAVGGDAGEGAGAGGVNHPGGGVGLPHGRLVVVGPAAAGAFERGALPLKLQADGARETVDGDLAGSAEVGRLAFAQTGPENQGEQTADGHHWHRQPIGSTGLQGLVSVPGDHEQGEAGEKQQQGDARGQAGLGTPVISHGHLQVMAKQDDDGGRAQQRTEQGEGEDAAGLCARYGEPGDHGTGKRQGQGNQKRHRFAAGNRGRGHQRRDP